MARRYADATRPTVPQPSSMHVDRAHTYAHARFVRVRARVAADAATGIGGGGFTGALVLVLLLHSDASALLAQLAGRMQRARAPATSSSAAPLQPADLKPPANASRRGGTSPLPPGRSPMGSVVPVPGKRPLVAVSQLHKRYLPSGFVAVRSPPRPLQLPSRSERGCGPAGALPPCIGVLPPNPLA